MKIKIGLLQSQLIILVVIMIITSTLFVNLILPIVSAEVECNKVLIVDFNYNQGIIDYKDKIIKCGYSPDSIIQPEEGYTAQLISIDNELLYSSKFEIPLKLNVDLSNAATKSLSGGIVILNETEFALIFPYCDKARSIVLLNPKKYEILTIPLIEYQLIQKRSFWWILGLILILFAFIYRVYRRRKSHFS